MRLASLVSLALAVGLGAGCGARSGEDELLTTDLTGVGGLATGGSGGSGGAATGGGPAAGGGPGACCTVSFGPGCPDESVKDCVCATDTFCCTGAWDATCVVE